MKHLRLSIRKYSYAVSIGALLAFLLAGCVSGETQTFSTPLAITSPGSTPDLTPTATRPAQPTALTPDETSEPTQAAIPEQPRPLFAAYPLEPVSVRPALQQEAIDPQMGNVLVPLVLSTEQLERLAKSGVVASPADYPEFHFLYQETDRSNLPVFVTSDALLHAYHLTFDQLLSLLEEQVFLSKLRELNQVLLAQAQVQSEQLKGTAWEDPARRLYAYLVTGSKLAAGSELSAASELADADFELPQVVRDLAQAELDLIEAASAAAPSPIFPHLKYGEDYTQYVPRGHYTKSDALKAYFKSMMWYGRMSTSGRMTFRLNDPENPAVGPDETRMALLLALAVRDAQTGSQSALELWQLLYDPTAFLVGRSDELTIEDYLKLMDEVYGPQADLDAIADDTRLQSFIAATDRLPAPRILGLLSDDYKPLEAVKGLRLMGLRFLLENGIRAVFDKSTIYLPCEIRLFHTI